MSIPRWLGRHGGQWWVPATAAEEARGAASAVPVRSGAHATVDMLDELRRGAMDLDPAAERSIPETAWENPLSGIGSVWCCLGNAGEDSAGPFDAFVRSNGSLSGAVDGVRVPADSAGGLRKVRHELEVGLILGDEPGAEPLKAVSGVFLALDLAASGDEDRSFRKSFPTLCPVGPVVVPVEHAGTLSELSVELAVNGVVRQSTRVADLLRGPSEVLSLLHRSVGLARGDVVLMGAPSGGGFLVPGDDVRGCWTLPTELRVATRS